MSNFVPWGIWTAANITCTPVFHHVCSRYSSPTPFFGVAIFIFSSIIMASQEKVPIRPFRTPDTIKARASASCSSCWHFISSPLNYFHFMFRTLKYYLVQHEQQSLLCSVSSWSGLYVGSGMLIVGHKGAEWTFTFPLQQNPYVTHIDIKLVHCFASECVMSWFPLPYTTSFWNTVLLNPVLPCRSKWSLRD